MVLGRRGMGRAVLSGFRWFFKGCFWGEAGSRTVFLFTVGYIFFFFMRRSVSLMNLMYWFVSVVSLL